MFCFEEVNILPLDFARNLVFLATNRSLAHSDPVQDHSPPTLDMMPDGQFRAAPPRLGWPARVFLVALGVSFVAGIVASVALLIYVALLLVPVALALAAYGYFSMRVQAWRAGRV